MLAARVPTKISRQDLNLLQTSFETEPENTAKNARREAAWSSEATACVSSGFQSGPQLSKQSPRYVIVSFLYALGQSLYDIFQYLYAMMISAYAFTKALSSPYIGYLSDRWGRRRVLVYTLVATALCLHCCGLAQTYLGVLACRLATGVVANGGLLTARATDIAADHAQRRRLFGLFTTAWAFARVAAVTLVQFFDMDIGAACRAAALCELAAAGLAAVAFTAPENLTVQRRRRAVAVSRTPSSSGGGILSSSSSSSRAAEAMSSASEEEVVKTRPSIRELIRRMLGDRLALLLFVTSMLTPRVDAAAFVSKRFGEGRVAEAVGVLKALEAVCVVLVGLVPQVEKRLVADYGDGGAAVAAAVAVAIGWLGIAAAPSMRLLYVLVALRSAFAALYDPATRSLVWARAEAEAKRTEAPTGSLVGLQTSLKGVSQVFGSWLGAYLTSLSVALPLGISAAISFANGVIIFVECVWGHGTNPRVFLWKTFLSNRTKRWSGSSAGKDPAPMRRTTSRVRVRAPNNHHHHIMPPARHHHQPARASPRSGAHAPPEWLLGDGLSGTNNSNCNGNGNGNGNDLFSATTPPSSLSSSSTLRRRRVTDASMAIDETEQHVDPYSPSPHRGSAPPANNHHSMYSPTRLLAPNGHHSTAAARTTLSSTPEDTWPIRAIFTPFSSSTSSAAASVGASSDHASRHARSRAISTESLASNGAPRCVTKRARLLCRGAVVRPATTAPSALSLRQQQRQRRRQQQQQQQQTPPFPSSRRAPPGMIFDDASLKVLREKSVSDVARWLDDRGQSLAARAVEAAAVDGAAIAIATPGELYEALEGKVSRLVCKSILLTSREAFRPSPPPSSSSASSSTSKEVLPPASDGHDENAAASAAKMVTTMTTTTMTPAGVAPLALCAAPLPVNDNNYTITTNNNTDDDDDDDDDYDDANDVVVGESSEGAIGGLDSLGRAEALKVRSQVGADPPRLVVVAPQQAAVQTALLAFGTPPEKVAAVDVVAGPLSPPSSSLARRGVMQNHHPVFVAHDAARPLDTVASRARARRDLAELELEYGAQVDFAVCDDSLLGGAHDNQRTYRTEEDDSDDDSDDAASPRNMMTGEESTHSLARRVYGILSFMRARNETDIAIVADADVLNALVNDAGEPADPNVNKPFEPGELRDLRVDFFYAREDSFDRHQNNALSF